MAWQQKNLAAMQASAESAMTEALLDAPRAAALSLSESVTTQYSESADPPVTVLSLAIWNKLTCHNPMWRSFCQ
jgi:hypothetical protein